jgi:hypothetical protein
MIGIDVKRFVGKKGKMEFKDTAAVACRIRRLLNSRRRIDT